MHKTYILILVCSFFLAQSCELEDNSEVEFGTNSVKAEELLQASIKQIAYNHSAIGGRSSAVIMQYFNENDASNQFYEEYNFQPLLFDDMWSVGFYSGSLSSLNKMYNLANEANDLGLVAIAQILLAQEYGVLSNMFGDIPFNEALQGEGITKPKFDTQQEIYLEIINMLDEAIDKIGSSTNIKDLLEDDLIYRGDMQKWKKYAFGLKARFLFNQRNQDPSVDAEILMLLENSFTNSAEQAEYTFDLDFTNPQYRFAYERPSTFSCGDYFINQLLAIGDPRLASFAFTEFDNWEYFSPYSFIPKWFKEDAKIPLLSYTELLFIKTELSIYTNTGELETSELLESAITSSMLENDIDLDSSTLAFIANRSDLIGLSSDDATQKVISQAYLAYYGYNYLQSWINYRRTGYPLISTTASGPSPINPSNIVPRRFIYPESEFIYNLDNVEYAISNQGGADLDDNLWIFN